MYCSLLWYYNHSNILMVDVVPPWWATAELSVNYFCLPATVSCQAPGSFCSIHVFRFGPGYGRLFTYMQTWGLPEAILKPVKTKTLCLKTTPCKELFNVNITKLISQLIKVNITVPFFSGSIPFQFLYGSFPHLLNNHFKYFYPRLITVI